MGRSARKDSLRCMKCFEANWLNYSQFGSRYLLWRNVTAVKRIGEAVLCKCGNCGHQYISKSKAAYRAMNTVLNAAKKRERMKNPFKKSSIQVEPIPGSDYTQVLGEAKQIAKTTGQKVTFGFNRRIGDPLVEVQPDGNVSNDYLNRVK